jgi:hypothetical protein
MNMPTFSVAGSKAKVMLPRVPGVILLAHQLKTVVSFLIRFVKMAQSTPQNPGRR